MSGEEEEEEEEGRFLPPPSPCPIQRRSKMVFLGGDKTGEGGKGCREKKKM